MLKPFIAKVMQRKDLAAQEAEAAMQIIMTGNATQAQIGGYLAIGYALGHLPASVVSPTMIGQPVLTAFLAIFLLGEHLSSAQIIGGLIVLLGIFWVHRSRGSV